MPTIRRTVTYSRKNGGVIPLGEEIANIHAFKISSIIYEGGDLCTSRRVILRLLINDFVRGKEVTGNGLKPYTLIMDCDEEGEYDNTRELEMDWRVDDDTGEPKTINEISINATLNNNPAKDLKMNMELVFITN